MRSAIIDGEVIACDEGGLPNFAALMSGAQSAPLCLWVFDLLELNGDALTDNPIEQRRSALDRIVKKASDASVQYSPGFADAAALLTAVELCGLEGIVSKRLGSPYRSGPARTWLKTKTSTWRAANRERFKLF